MSEPHEEQERETTRDLVRRAEGIYAPAGWVVPAGVACLVVGAIAFAIGAALSPGWLWGSLLANWLFWTGIAQAAVVIAAIIPLAPARWGPSYQRIALGLASFLPVSLALFVVLWAGRSALFSWVGRPAGNPWLNAPELYGRDGLGIVLLTGFSLWFAGLSLRPDLGLLRERGVGIGRFGALMTRGWRGADEEWRRSARLMHNLAPVILIGYPWVYSLLAQDLLVALAPPFRSTVFLVIYFIGEFYAALAAVAVLAFAWRLRAGLGNLIAPFQSLDLGNLMWGASWFWMYLSWCEYVVIWYGNLPFRVFHFALKWRALPWEPVAWAALALTFFIPFLLLFSRPLKSSPRALAGIGGVVLAGVLMQQYLNVLPFVPALGPWPFGFILIGITIGFLGAVALPYAWLMRRVPLFPIANPLLFRAVALRDVEV